MIRITSDGNTIVWYKLSNGDYKIEWPLEVWLLEARTGKTLDECSMAQYKSGKVSLLTWNDKEDLVFAERFKNKNGV